ncbi:MAG: aminotransferase class III-fold pyridoxal phosphate-dependent enzyme, partial [Bacteroidota bacterium]
LIFDEVMTGFRLGFGGAQTLYDITADLVTYGKIIGAGLPVGAFAGKAEIMDCVAPVGRVYQAGTLSGNPLAMAAGYTLLNKLKSRPETYSELEQKTTYLASGLRQVLQEFGIPHTLNKVGSMLSIFYCEGPVTTFDEANKTNQELFGRIFHGMLKQGVYFPPSAFEAFFLSNALTTVDLDHTIDAFRNTISGIEPQK